MWGVYYGMQAKYKFIFGAVLVGGTVGFLMTSGIKETGVYFLTPSELAAKVEDGAVTYPVVYRGLAPDTFTDDVDVVVEGRLEPDGTFRATSLLAKCGSRYETTPEA